MVLSDSTIKEMGDSLVSPFKIENVSASSIDLTLADDFIDNKGIRHHLSDGCKSFPILANEFWLMSTNETVKVPKDCVGIVKGKSSLARKGIMIECAGVCDAGWDGQVTLEVKNLNPDVDVSLTPGQKICQIVFVKMDKLAEVPYSTESGHHYQDQKGTTRAWDAESEQDSRKKQRIVGVLGLNRNDDAVMVRYTYLKPFYYPNDSNGTMVNTSDFAESERFVRFSYEYDIDLSGKPCSRLKNYIAFFNQMLDSGYIRILNPEVLEWEGK